MHRAYERGRKLARRITRKRLDEMKATVVERLKASKSESASRKDWKGSR